MTILLWSGVAFILLFFVQVLLFVDVYKKKTSDPKEFLGYPTLGRDP